MVLFGIMGIVCPSGDVRWELEGQKVTCISNHVPVQVMDFRVGVFCNEPVEILACNQRVVDDNHGGCFDKGLEPKLLEDSKTKASLANNSAR